MTHRNSSVDRDPAARRVCGRSWRAGCHLELDRVAREFILKNVRNAVADMRPLRRPERRPKLLKTLPVFRQ